MKVYSVHQHRLVCGDITNSKVVETLMKNDKADIIYSDPPWGPGNQKYWHTMKEKGSVPQTDWMGFLRTFASVCSEHRTSEAPVFVEMGLRWIGDLDTVMKEVGLPLLGRWEIFYGTKKKPFKNTVAAYGADYPEFVLPSPPHGEPVTRAILEAVVKKGDIVLDPCTGKGMTARITHKLGGVFRGSEMNVQRLHVTKQWLEKAAGVVS